MSAPRCTIGVDLGGTKLLAGVVSPTGEVLHRVHRPVRGLDREALLGVLEAAVREALEVAGGAVSGVGFGIHSLIDRATGHSVRCNHLPLDDFPIAAHLREHLGVPVAVDNDGNCAALAETSAGGAAAGARNAVVLTLGTGIGGGLVLDGRIYRGAAGAAAEIGHMVVDVDGPRCFGACPGRGCLEALASGSALTRDALAAASSDPDGALARALASSDGMAGEVVSRLAGAGEELSLGILGRIGRRLGAGLAGLAMIFNPEVVVVGGGVMGAGDLILGPARDELARRAMEPSRSVPVLAAALGEEAGMVGAARLAAAEAS